MHVWGLIRLQRVGETRLWQVARTNSRCHRPSSNCQSLRLSHSPGRSYWKGKIGWRGQSQEISWRQGSRRSQSIEGWIGKVSCSRRSREGPGRSWRIGKVETSCHCRVSSGRSSCCRSQSREGWRRETSRCGCCKSYCRWASKTRSNSVPYTTSDDPPTSYRLNR